MNSTITYKFLRIFLLSVLTAQVLTRISSSTTNDGVLNNLNAWIYLDGESGIQFPETISNLNTYTFSFWFRVHENPVETRKEMVLIDTVPDAFTCSLTRNEKLQCGTIRGDAYSVSIPYLRRSNWYIFSMRSSQNSSLLQIREMSFDTIFQQTSSNRFFPFGASSLSFNDMYVGISRDKKSNGLNGSVRLIRLFDYILEDLPLKRSQYTYIYPTKNLRQQLILEQNTTMRNDASRSIAKLVGKNAKAQQEVDFFGSVSCFTLPPRENYLDFNDEFALDNLTLTKPQLNSTSKLNTTLQLWFKRSNTAEITPNVDPNEHLFIHTNVLQASFFLTFYNNLRVFGQYPTNNSLLFEVGYNRWFYLDVISTPTRITSNLYENDGTLVKTQTMFYNLTYSIVSDNKITIGQNFRGQIHGIKYYKTDKPPNTSIYNMVAGLDTNSNILFYYSFIDSNMDSNTSFKNFANNFKNQTINIKRGSNTVFYPHYLRPYGSNNVVGTVDEPIEFDGYTCVDKKEKLQMTGEESYARGAVTLNDTLPSFTFEFWFKVAKSQIGNFFLLSLQDVNQTKLVYTVIRQEGKDLRCYPFFQQDQSQFLNYLDYNFDAKTWQHISCVYNGPDKSILGIIGSNQQSYSYFQNINITRTLPKLSYNLYLNLNPLTMKGGYQQSFYQELKFWRMARSQEQIRLYMYRQVYIPWDGPDLYAYYKLMNGRDWLTGIEKELDYSDSSFQKTLQISNTQWVSQGDLLVCPLALFLSSDNQTVCYREALQELSLTIYKENDTYVITPFFSKYLSIQIRDMAYIIYNYQWTLRNIKAESSNTAVFPSYFQPQETNMSLKFNLTQVSKGIGNYEFILNALDKWQTQNYQEAKITLKTLECANIFDFYSRKSFAYQDMASTKSVDDAIFRYEYTECSDYKFDQDSMTFEIDINGVSFNARDHSKKEKTLTLRKTLQGQLPNEELFHIQIKGAWRNTKNRNDIIYYSLIYACRYGSKLVVTLETRERVLVAGENLTIKYQANYYNLRDAIGQRSYTTRWECPEVLKTYCQKISSQSELQIPYNDIKDIVPLGKPLTFALVANTNFIQSDGLRYSRAVVDIIWIDSKLNANSRQLSSQEIVGDVYGFQVDIDTLDDSQIDIRWSTIPTIASSCYTNFDSRKQFIIRTSCLFTGINYNVTVQLYYKGEYKTIWQNTHEVLVPGKPKGGRITCSPTNGTAYTTNITCQTSGWIFSTAATSGYQFYTQNGDNGLLIEQSSLTNLLKLTISNLPPTTKVYVKAVDSLGNFEYAFTPVTIRFYANQSQNITQKFATSLNSIDTKKVTAKDVEQVLLVSQSLNNVKQDISVQTLNKMTSEATTILSKVSQNIESLPNKTDQTFALKATAESFSKLTNDTPAFNTTNLEVIQQSIKRLVSRTGLVKGLTDDVTFNTNILDIQSNILQQLNKQEKNKTLTKTGQVKQITESVRDILTDFESQISQNIFESSDYNYSTKSFSFAVAKFSRLNNVLNDVEGENSEVKVKFPLASATQPTNRQTLTMMKFNVSPFIGGDWEGQTALSNGSVYFSYRDENGTYLTGDKIDGNIEMNFKYDFQEGVDPPNTTKCGYINVGDLLWQTAKCNTTLQRDQRQISCSCKHMSFYSIIDDSFRVQPQKYQDYYSVITWIYIALIFLVGTIYSYSKDNQDFKDLYEYDDSQGHVLISKESITLQALAFKRKVYYMSYSNDKYSFWTLYKLFLQRLHPVFQIRNTFDPELPRFYKFLLLFTRIMVLYILVFIFLRGYKDFPSMNDDDLTLALIRFLFLTIVAAFIFLPFPAFVLFLCRSTFYYVLPRYLIKERSGSVESADQAVANGVPTEDEEKTKKQRISQVKIDPNLPLKLLFHLNSANAKRLAQDQQKESRLKYSAGNLKDIGKKLLELDEDINYNTENSRDSYNARVEDQYIWPPTETEKKTAQGQQNSEPSSFNSKISKRFKEKKQSPPIKIKTRLDLEGSQKLPDFERRKSSEFILDINAAKTGVHANNYSFNQEENFTGANEVVNQPNGPNPSRGKSSSSQDSQLPGTISNSDIYLEENMKNHELVYSHDQNQHEGGSPEEVKTPDDQNDHEFGRNLDSSKKLKFAGGSSLDEFELPQKEKREYGYGDDEDEEDRIHRGYSTGKHLIEQNDKDLKGKDDLSQLDFMYIPSIIGSSDERILHDEPKEIIEVKNFWGRLLANIIFLIINLGVIAAFFSIYGALDHYDNDENYVWIVSFFVCQFLGLFVFDFIILLFLALSVSKCLRSNKVCLAQLYRESLYTYEDYRYVAKFTQKKLL